MNTSAQMVTVPTSVALEDSDCDAVVLLLDCCYSGAAAGDTRGDVESQLRSLQELPPLEEIARTLELEPATPAQLAQQAANEPSAPAASGTAE